jgi:hypothetical protein
LADLQILGDSAPGKYAPAMNKKTKKKKAEMDAPEAM